MWIEITTGLIAFLAFLIDLWVNARAWEEVDAAMRNWHSKAVSNRFSSESREHAVQKLESEVHSGFWYSLLRRISGLAPLLGVIVTALSLLVVSKGGGDARQTGADAGFGALVALRPVFGGVLLGAFISVVNQYLIVKFEARLQTALHERVDSVPSEHFAGIRDVLGTLPAELKQVVDALQSSRRSLFDMQQTTTDEMGKVLTRVRNEVLHLAESATAAGLKLRESAAQHFDQVKVTSKEFGKTVSQLAEIVERSNEQLGGSLTAAADQLTGAQEVLARSMQTIQVSVSGAVVTLDKQAEFVQRSTDVALSVVRKSVDDSMIQHHGNVASFLKDRAEASDRALGEVQKLMLLAVASSEKSIEQAVRDLSKATGGLGGLSTSLVELEKQIGVAVAQAKVGASASDTLAKGLAGLDGNVRSSSERLTGVMAGFDAKTSDLVKRLEGTEERLGHLASTLGTGLVSIDSRFSGLNDVTKDLVAQNQALSARLGTATTGMAELQRALVEAAKPRGWFPFGGR